MIGRPVQVFTRNNASYYGKDITRIRPYMYSGRNKLTRNIIGCYANSFCLYCLGDVMSCGKGRLVVNEKPCDPK